MKYPKITTVFKVKVNYKSGLSEVFECYKLSIKGKNLEWESFNHRNKPIDIAFNSVSDIESIWQIGYRKVIVWK